MDPSILQKVLTQKFQAEPNRVARVAHFTGMLKTAIDGLAQMGVVVHLDVDGFSIVTPPEPLANPLESLEEAISLMQKASQGVYSHE